MIYKKKFHRSNKGSIIAEAALIIPILLAITFFVMEFGTVLYISNSLNQIARAAARYASVTSSFTTQQVITASGADSVLPDINNFTLTITPAAGSSRAVGATITVNVEYTYTPIVNPFGLLNSNSTWAPKLKSASVARAEVAS